MNIQVNITSTNFSTATKEEMWNVYKNYYNYTKESFMARISKNNYYAVYTADSKIVGFTGLRINRTKIDGKKSLLIYFGQTVVDSAHRGKSLIQLTGSKLCLKYFRDILFSNVYFWADALTYKAYLVFAKTLDQYYPSPQFETPQHVRNLTHFIGETHYGENYSPETGTVTKDEKFVNDPSVAIREKDLNDPFIKFYKQVNPNHEIGHGLITLAPVNSQNFFILVKKYIRKAFGISAKKSVKVNRRPVFN